MNWWKRILNNPRENAKDQERKFEAVRLSDTSRKKKIEKGAEDFAVRFEDVMRDLARG